MRVPFGLQSYQHTSLPLSAQRMVNCRLEPAPPHAKTQAAVITDFGVANWAAAQGKLRGALFVRGKLYVVAGESLIYFNAIGTPSILGTVPGSNFVFMAGDETHVLVITNPDGYYWNGTSVAKVSDVDWPGAQWCGYLDGYFIIIPPNGGQFYITANRNPASIDALDFASAERYPDDLVTGIVDHGEFIAFGTESGEGFYNSGATDFPLSKISSADFEIGCLCPRGPQKVDNTIFFPGHDGKVYRLNGYTPQVISTPVVEQAMSRATDRNFVGLVWKEPGAVYYGLKCADFFFAYNIATGLWNEKESYGYTSQRWEFVLNAYEKWIVGDKVTGALGYLSADTFTEFGEVLRASCTSPALGQDNQRVTLNRIELVFEQGVGLLTGQGEDPKVMLEVSGDGGRTWGSERWRSLGRMGDYNARAVWYRGGQHRDPILRYSISDPVRRNLILATAEIELDAA